MEEQDEVQTIPTEKESLDEDKCEPKMKEYETELQVEEPGKLLYSVLIQLSLGYHMHQILPEHYKNQIQISSNIL